jgi:glycosyltransferase involved in cell wall biosynthesis
MNILYIITQADGGGAQKYVLALAKYFRGAIVAGDEAAKLFDDAKAAGLETFTLKHLRRNIHPWHDFWAIWEIRELVKNLRPDIVHLNSTKAGVLGSFACMGIKTKVVFTAHGFRYNEPLSYLSKNFYLAGEKIASSYRDYIICVSDADKESALKHHLIAPNKISTIYNGLPALNFLAKDEACRALNLPPHPFPSPSGLRLRGSDSRRRGIKGGGDKFIFVTVANFYKTKGIDILIEAVRLLPGEIKDKSLFAIIGDGSEFENCKLKIEKLKLSPYIKLLGKILDAKQYLKAFDGFILPSRKEGFPFTMLEAMQAGLPIIATNVGGIPEALGDDAGILIKPEDPKALGEAIEAVLEDKNKATELSQKAAERSKLFTQEKMLAETQKIYELVFQN